MDLSNIKLNSMQKSLAKAMLLTGASIDNVLQTVEGYGGNPSMHNDTICPRCSGTMQIVQLIGGRRAYYCPVDRVTIPLAVREPEHRGGRDSERGSIKDPVAVAIRKPTWE